MEIPFYLQGGCITQKMIQMARMQMVADSFNKQKSIEFQTTKAVATIIDNQSTCVVPPEQHVVKPSNKSKPHVRTILYINGNRIDATLEMKDPRWSCLVKPTIPQPKLIKVDKEVQCELPKLKID